MTGAALELRKIRKEFGGNEVLRGIDLTVRAGEVVAIIGPSGSGKSTLLRTINHLAPPTSGVVLLDDEIVGYRRGPKALHQLSERALLRQRTRVGFVFQAFNLFPHLTVLENVSEAQVSSIGRDKAAARDASLGWLDRVGLRHKADAYPRQLSGGEQQRVAIARALALDPELLLFDEPTSALDPELVDEVLQVIRDLAQRGRTLVIVTHEIAFARQIADTVVFMDDGAIVESGSPHDVLDNPSSRRLQDFLSKLG